MVEAAERAYEVKGPVLAGLWERGAVPRPRGLPRSPVVGTALRTERPESRQLVAALPSRNPQRAEALVGTLETRFAGSDEPRWRHLLILDGAQMFACERDGPER
jgi:hypothetical protein